MNILNQKCSLCNNYLIPSNFDGYLYNCPSCHVEFHINNGHCFGMTYGGFQDPDIFAVSMHLDTEFTIIYFTNSSPLREKYGKYQLAIKGAWPQTKPQDILNLANRLLGLLIFL